jgi:parallel beta helix pectate lyase-like protein
MRVKVEDFGAVGDGTTDDTAAIQAAVNAAEIIEFAQTSYLVNQDIGIRIPSNKALELGTAQLVTTPKTGAKRRVLETIPGSSNISITGGVLRGSVDNAGIRFSIGLRIDGASSVMVDGLVANGFWFDGIWIGNKSQGITLRHVWCSYNRRNGLSIVDGSVILIEDSVFENTIGQDPQSGIDVEPGGGERVTDLKIRNCRFTNNSGVGLYCHTGGGFPGRRYRFVSCAFDGNAKIGLVINAAEDSLVSDCTISRSPLGISIGSRAQRAVLVGNDVTNCPIPMKLVGVRDPRIVSNGISRIDLPFTEATGPAVVGDVVMVDNV